MIELAYQKLILPAFEGLLKRRRTFQHWRSLEQSQWWTTEQLKELQLARLRTLLFATQQSSPWYRDRWKACGIEIHKIDSLEQVAELPVTTRLEMTEAGSAIRSTEPALRYVSKTTGGSSGMPLRFVISNDANDRRVAATFRGYQWAGAGPGTRQSYLWSTPFPDAARWRKAKESLYAKWLYRRDMLDCFAMSRDNTPKYVDRINRYRPRVIVAYAASIFALAKSIQELGLTVRSPESIVVGAEKLHDFQREKIEEVFQSPVFETYGSREFTLIGAECEHHSGLHLSSENLIVEIVDEQGKPLPPGQEGRVVITDLFNFAMPFIRYAIDDRAIASDATCACGRGLPLLKQVVGRQADILQLPNGQILSGLFFPHLIKDIDQIERYQVIQTAPDMIELKIVASVWNDELQESLQQKVRQSIGAASRILIEVVPQIEPTAEGKMRVVIGYRPGRMAG